jgi:phenylalanyl-tRNA synthetase beta chain
VSDVRLFTVGARFVEPFAADGLPAEVSSFAAVIAGYRHGMLEKPAEVDVFDAKGVTEAIVERATGRAATILAQTHENRATFLHPRGAASVFVDDKSVGCFGPLHPDVADLLDLGGACVVIDLDVDALREAGLRVPQFTPIPVLPPATRDIALVVHDDVTAGSVGAAIRDAGGSLCESVELFDLFRGGQVPSDHRSLAFHVVYRDPRAATDPDSAKTLTDEEVDKRHEAVVAAVQEKFGAVLRA